LLFVSDAGSVLQIANTNFQVFKIGKYYKLQLCLGYHNSWRVVYEGKMLLSLPYVPPEGLAD
jgi:hypothetical protein